MSSRTEELRRRVRETEAENEELAARLSRCNRQVMRLRLEKRILLDHLDTVAPQASNSRDAVPPQ